MKKDIVERMMMEIAERQRGLVMPQEQWVEEDVLLMVLDLHCVSTLGVSLSTERRVKWGVSRCAEREREGESYVQQRATWRNPALNSRLFRTEQAVRACSSVSNLAYTVPKEGMMSRERGASCSASKRL